MITKVIQHYLKNNSLY